MRTLRIFLQLVIISAGGIALVALISQTPVNVVNVGILLGAIAFLFALTLVLKEHTDKRLIPGHKLSLRPIGIVLLSIGAFFIFLGVSFFTGNQALPDGSGRCRAICGLILLASQLFGETFARFFASSLWACIGLLLCFVGYKVKGVKET